MIRSRRFYNRRQWALMTANNGGGPGFPDFGILDELGNFLVDELGNFIVWS